jgi:hypothetical protein
MFIGVGKHCVQKTVLKCPTIRLFDNHDGYLISNLSPFDPRVSTSGRGGMLRSDCGLLNPLVPTVAQDQYPLPLWVVHD